MAFKMNPKSPALKSMSRYTTPQAIKPAVTSPAKQTASQKKNLPKDNVINKQFDLVQSRFPNHTVQRSKQNFGSYQVSSNESMGGSFEYTPGEKVEKLSSDSKAKKSPAKIRKANSTKNNNQPTAGVESKKTSKFMRKAGTLASGGGQDRNVTRSPAKQKVNRDDGVQVKEVPKVVGEEVKKATDFVGKEGKKAWGFLKRTVKKIGNVKLTPTKKEKIKKAKEKLEKLNKKQ
jgi:hypothetical protein